MPLPIAIWIWWQVMLGIPGYTKKDDTDPQK